MGSYWGSTGELDSSWNGWRGLLYSAFLFRADTLIDYGSWDLHQMWAPRVGLLLSYPFPLVFK